MTKEDVLRCLRLPETDPSSTDDLQYVLRRSNAMGQRGLNQARSLMSKDAFKTLLSKDESGLLMVDGHCKADGAGKISPLSVWSASFAASLTQSASVMALSFFCGLHSQDDSNDPYAGPVGLIKSIMGELIRQADHVDRMGHVDPRLVKDVTEDNLEAMSGLLKNLLGAVDPEKTVYIIIDNISEFEGMTWNGWSDQILLVFTTLRGLVQGEEDKQGTRTRPRVKMLVTSANKSIGLGRLVAEDEIVGLRC